MAFLSGTSDWRPRIVAPLWNGRRVRSRAQQVVQAAHDRGDFSACKQFAQIAQRLPALDGHLRVQRFQVGAQFGFDRFTTEFPDHGAQLVFGMKTDAMVDGPDPSVGAYQAMAALAVRVIDEKVKE